MSRATMLCLGLLTAALSMPYTLVPAQAAGSGLPSFASAPRSMGPATASVHQKDSRGRWARADSHRGPRYGHGRLGPIGYPGPWTNPAPSRFGQMMSDPGQAPERAIDRNSFEHMRVSVGIARAPTPEPTLYRLEGRRDRPATRVIRISDAEPRSARRTRFAHAETGALLLIVPGR